jgi:hypothetical protein
MPVAEIKPVSSIMQAATNYHTLKAIWQSYIALWEHFSKRSDYTSTSNAYQLNQILLPFSPFHYPLNKIHTFWPVINFKYCGSVITAPHFSLKHAVTAGKPDILLLSTFLKNYSLFMACYLLACSNAPKNSLLMSQ